jgi:hypothetical protein
VFFAGWKLVEGKRAEKTEKAERTTTLEPYHHWPCLISLSMVIDS